MKQAATRNQGGFTLIEMAIVLIIIGLVIGAVLKGQDLIENARAKQFTSWVKQAEVAAWTIYDREGKFPGDSDGDGDIDTGAGTKLEDVEGFNSYTKTFGSLNFRLGLGTAQTGGTVLGTAIVVENSSSSQFSDDEKIYLQSFDASVDGTADTNTGKVVCMSGVTVRTGGNYGSTNAYAFNINAAGNDDWMQAGSGCTSMAYLFERGEL